MIHSIRKVEDLRKKDSDFNSLISNFLEGFQLDFAVFHSCPVDRPAENLCEPLSEPVDAGRIAAFEPHFFHKLSYSKISIKGYSTLFNTPSLPI